MTARQYRAMDEVDAATFAQTWLQHFIDLNVPPAPNNPDWRVSAVQTPCDSPESGTKITTLWYRDRPRAFYVLQRDSANFSIATMVEIPQ